MKEQIRLFKELAETNSILQKKELLKYCENNEFFKEVLKFMLNPYTVTGIKEKKWDKIQPTQPYQRQENIQNEFLNILNIFKHNSIGNNSTIELIKNISANWDKEEQDFLKQVIIKSLRLGANSAIINDVYGEGFIPEFGVQLGVPFSSVNLVGDEWKSITRKFNGTRCVYINGKLYTRNGREYTGLEHILKEIEILNELFDVPMFFDGELLYKNPEGLSDGDAFRKGTGIANSKTEEKTELMYMIFDAFPLEEYYKGQSNETYKERCRYLNTIRECAQNLSEIDCAKTIYQGTDHKMISHYVNEAEELGWEGIMINLDSKYECKRISDLIKVKKFKSCDIRCIRVERGTGRNKDRMGKIICLYKGCEVGVGSGFSDIDRTYFWEHPDEIIGKIVSVQYKEESKKKEGKISLQFPVFECVRFDKNEESYE